MKNNKFNYIDLYAGIGGFRQVLDKDAGECVFSTEIDAWAIRVYEDNYRKKGERSAFFDMDKFSTGEISREQMKEMFGNPGDVKLIAGGFPCQPFSVGGKREGFGTTDTKGTQFHNIMTLVDYVKPKYLFLENVKHLYTHDEGRTWKVIQEEIERRGYKIPKNRVLLSPTHLGIPQNRERVFIIAYRDEQPIPFIQPKIPKVMKEILDFTNKEYNKKFKIKSEQQVVFKAWQEFIKAVKFPKNRTLPVIWLDEMLDMKQPTEDMSQWRKKYLIDMNKFYLRNSLFIDEWAEKHNVRTWSKRDKKLEWQAGKEERDFKNTIITLRQSGIRLKAKPIYPTLVAMVQTPIVWDKTINSFRYITTREAANLQSFPESFRLGENQQQSYRQLGNSVNVDVIEHLYNYYFK